MLCEQWKSTNVVDYNELDDMIFVPSKVLSFEKSSLEIKPKEGNAGQPPKNGCLNLKVVFNRAWIDSAGGGSSKVARQRLAQVLSETENIYNHKFHVRNQLYN